MQKSRKREELLKQENRFPLKEMIYLNVFGSIQREKIRKLKFLFFKKKKNDGGAARFRTGNGRAQNLHWIGRHSQLK